MEISVWDLVPDESAQFLELVDKHLFSVVCCKLNIGWQSRIATTFFDNPTFQYDTMYWDLCILLSMFNLNVNDKNRCPLKSQ